MYSKVTKHETLFIFANKSSTSQWQKGHKRITFYPQYLEVQAFKVRYMVIKGENCLTFFLHETSKTFSARNAIQWKHQREQGSLGELSWLWHMPPTCWGTFRAICGDLSSWLPEMSVRAAQLNHCKPFWMSPAYLRKFNWDGYTDTANIWRTLSLRQFATLLSDELLSFFLISTISDASYIKGSC